jgi:hypothetical protein
MVNLHGEQQSRDAKKENLYINPLLLCCFAIKIPNVKGVQYTRFPVQFSSR